MLVEWIMAIIVAYNPAWGPRDCQAENDACVAQNERTEENLRGLARAITVNSEREGLDPLMVTSIISRESSFREDPCGRRVPLDRIVHREVVDAETGREKIKWVCNRFRGMTCERDAWEIREEDGHLVFSTCSAGEIGHMQILPGSEWTRSGTIIPGTEHTLTTDSDGVTVRYELPMSATRNSLAVFVDYPDNEGEYPQLPRSGFDVVHEDGSYFLVLDEPVDAGGSIIVHEALSTAYRERRLQMAVPRINIAIGCAELAYHYERYDGDEHPWWYWVGAYNTGTRRGDAARRYSSRIVGRYRDFCDYMVPTEDGEVKLYDVWEPCEYVVDEAEENPEEY